MPRGFLSEDAERRSGESERPPVVVENVICLRATARAILIRRLSNSFGVDQIWVPQSVVHVDSEVYAEGHKGKLVIAAWWAARNGIKAT